jgi:hypothetical protein
MRIDLAKAGTHSACTQCNEYSIDFIISLLILYFLAMDFTRSICQSCDDGDKYIRSINESNLIWIC